MVCFPWGAAAVDGPPGGDPALMRSNLKVFDAVWELVAQKYYDPNLRGVDWAAARAAYRPQAASAADAAALHRSINAMLALLHDPHTRLLKSSAVHFLRSDKGVDIGLLGRWLDGRWVVLRVVPGTPAEAAGIKPGWIVVAVNGHKIGDPAGDSFDPAVGDVGRFDLLDTQDRPVVVSLRFQKVTVKSERHNLPGGVTYVRFDRFDFGSCFWLARQIIDVAYDDPPGPAVVIDLRTNVGGQIALVGAALKLFFSKSIDYGALIDRQHGQTRLHVGNFGSPRYHGKVVILVGDATASAAELFAAVMQRERGAVLVGQPTAGAGLGAEFFSLSDGSTLELGMMDLVLPDGTRFEGQGVKPDIAVPAATLADLRAGRDPELAAATAFLNSAVGKGGR